MDPVLSTIFPTYNIGSDGFNWFIGQVENVIDIKNSGRVQVRIVGVHHKKGTVTKTEDLPWANVMLPVNVPFGTGQPAGSNNLKVGAWVIGFYLDPDGQKPLIIGSIASTQASTFKDVQDILPGFDSLELSNKRVTGNTLSEAVNGAIHRSASEVKDGKNEKGASTEGGEPAVKKSAKSGGVPAALAALKGTNSDTNPTGGKVCVPLADANCDAKDIGSAIKRVLSELLASSQNSGGNLGDYYISKANGLLYSGVDIPREYITQITRLTNSFALRIKKEIFFGIRDAIEELVKLIIGVESAKQVAETAEDKPKNPKESYVPNTERGNFLQEVIDTFNKILNEVGCSFKKTIDDLINYLIDLILEYLQDAFTAANCLIDNIVNSAVSFIESGFTSLVESVLGPLQSLLGTAGSFLNIVGGVINRVLNILGISCTGPDKDCKKDKNICSDGSNDEDDEDEDDASFFDKLIKEIENGSLRGTDLSGDISQFTRGVCEDATKNSQKNTKAKLTGGVLNDSQTNTYVAVSEATPNIPLSVSEYPTSFPNTITTPDLNRDVSDNIDYFITAQEDRIKSGEIAKFDIVGPERNGVLEIDYIEESYNIASEAGVVYPPCIISSEDGQAFGLEIEVSRGQFGEAYLRILNPGRRFLVGTSFILNGSKIGGEDGTNDIPFTISSVGELLDLKIFGDVFEKNLLDSERGYEEFSELLYTEPKTISFVTVKNTTVEMPSFLGVEILQKRAAASVTIWDEKPEDQFPEEKFNNKLVTITTEKDEYLEGETIEYIIETVGYEEGTTFTYELFGSISTNDYVDVTAGEVTVDADGNTKAFVFIKEDEEFERLESLTLLLLNSSIPLGSRTLFVSDKEEEEEEDRFVLSQETTEQELLDYLNGLDLTTTTDFGNFEINLPPELAPLPQLTIPPEPAIDEYIPPELGDPIVDEDGSIISIPVSYPGNKSFQVPPKVTINGDGYGAAAIALLDDRGFVSEIRVTKIGIGYKPNLPADNDINCVIDSFTIIRPGFNYNTAPTIFVNGDSKVAEAIINEDGFISGVNVLNRSITYDTIPEIIVVGGEGIGGFVLPSLVCLPPTELEAKGYVKIGTGTYIDCP